MWLKQKGCGHLKLLKPPAFPQKNAGAEARKEHESALEKRYMRNDNAYYATSVQQIR